MALRKLTAAEVTFEVYTQSDNTPLEGNVMATNEPDLDKEAEDGIRARLERGDYEAWCGVCVKATWRCAAGVEYSGSAALWGCSLDDAYTAAVAADEHGLHAEALADLQSSLALQAARCASIARTLRARKAG